MSSPSSGRNGRGRRRIRWRRLAHIVVAVGVLLPLVSSSDVGADDTDTSAQGAAEAIADARERANEAAVALFDAESRIEALRIDGERLASDVSALEERVEGLRRRVTAIVVNRFTSTGEQTTALLSSFQSAKDQVEMDAFIDVIRDTSDEDFDRFESLNRELVRKKERLAVNQSQAAQERERLAELKMLQRRRWNGSRQSRRSVSPMTASERRLPPRRQSEPARRKSPAAPGDQRSGSPTATEQVWPRPPAPRAATTPDKRAVASRRDASDPAGATSTGGSIGYAPPATRRCHLATHGVLPEAAAAVTRAST